MYEQCCYNILRVVGKAVEVSHKSGGKSQEQQGLCCMPLIKMFQRHSSTLLWISLLGSQAQQSWASVHSKAISQIQVTLGKRCC